jgi:hypothetical protein
MPEKPKRNETLARICPEFFDVSDSEEESELDLSIQIQESNKLLNQASNLFPDNRLVESFNENKFKQIPPSRV